MQNKLNKYKIKYIFKIYTLLKEVEKFEDPTSQHKMDVLNSQLIMKSVFISYYQTYDIIV